MVIGEGGVDKAASDAQGLEMGGFQGGNGSSPDPIRHAATIRWKLNGKVCPFRES